jgi:hypothetical protein
MSKVTNAAVATTRTVSRANRCEMKFKGKCSELKGSVYDVVSGKDSFAKMTSEKGCRSTCVYHVLGGFKRPS